MPIDQERIATLRKKLAEATDFLELWEYFLTHFAENPEFHELGRPAEASFLLEVIGELGSKLLNQQAIRISQLMLIEIPEASLFHGACLIEGRLAGLMFFQDLDMGLMALSEISGKTMLARFSIRNPKGGETVH